jgi:hypothetical protein
MHATRLCCHNSSCFHSRKLGCSKFELSAKNEIFCAPSFKLYEVDMKFVFYPHMTQWLCSEGFISNSFHSPPYTAHARTFISR